MIVIDYTDIERGKNTMELQRLLSYTRKAVDDYSMINSGDKIAVGISGGKDSLTLLYALHGLRRFYANNFEIEAVTVNAGIEGMDFSPISRLCDELDVNYTVIDTDIYDTSIIYAGKAIHAHCVQSSEKVLSIRRRQNSDVIK